MAEPPLPFLSADIDSSYTVLFLVLVVGGRVMGGGVSLPRPPLLLWTSVMGGGRVNLTLMLLLPMLLRHNVCCPHVDNV